MKKALALVLFASVVFGIAHGGQSISQEELIRRTQELYDSIPSGDQAPWRKYFADDCIFNDEKGRTFDKAKLVAEITPMPTGYSGAIKLANVESRIIGDTAVLSYDLNETETIFGQNLTARYHVTDTWLRRNGEWKILASQAHRYYEDPAAADPSQLLNYQPSTYIGTYELAPGQIRSITAENNNLFVERNGKKEQLLPEASDIFFRKGVEGRILFRYDTTGKVDALIDRRNNEDVVWKKTR
jgi:hypothetical protein